MSSTLLIPIVLQFVGVGVIIAEFIVPTAGVLATLAIGVFGFSLVYAFAKISVSAGVVFVLADLLMVPILVVVGAKMLASSRATLSESLSNKEGAVSQPPEWSALAGKEGATVSALHPAGSAMINGVKYDVVSRGEFIEKGKPVIVVTIDGNRIVVKRKE